MLQMTPPPPPPLLLLLLLLLTPHNDFAFPPTRGLSRDAAARDIKPENIVVDDDGNVTLPHQQHVFPPCFPANASRGNRLDLHMFCILHFGRLIFICFAFCILAVIVDGQVRLIDFGHARNKYDGDDEDEEDDGDGDSNGDGDGDGDGDEVVEEALLEEDASEEEDDDDDDELAALWCDDDEEAQE
jgi:serine/threonine protein kinase